jgi:hypothetical protein
MALFSQEALNPGVRKREVFGWAMYDFANSGYTTVVITAVFAAYFVGGIAQKAEWATFAWTAALSISYAIVMLTMPAIGAWADLRGAKKPVLRLDLFWNDVQPVAGRYHLYVKIRKTHEGQPQNVICAAFGAHCRVGV